MKRVTFNSMVYYTQESFTAHGNILEVHIQQLHVHVHITHVVYVMHDIVPLTVDLFQIVSPATVKEEEK